MNEHTRPRTALEWWDAGKAHAEKLEALRVGSALDVEAWRAHLEAAGETGKSGRERVRRMRLSYHWLTREEAAQHTSAHRAHITASARAREHAKEESGNNRRLPGRGAALAFWDEGEQHNRAHAQCAGNTHEWNAYVARYIEGNGSLTRLNRTRTVNRRLTRAEALEAGTIIEARRRAIAREKATAPTATTDARLACMLALAVRRLVKSGEGPNSESVLRELRTRAEDIVARL